MTLKVHVSEWFDRGVAAGAAYMVVVCDTFDHSDYPVFCKDLKSAVAVMHQPGEMQYAMECYDIHKDKTPQLEMTRCWALS